MNIIKKERRVDMKVYNDRFIIQTKNSPIKFYGQNGDWVEEVNEAKLYVVEEEAKSDTLKRSQMDGKELEYVIVPCLVTYNF